MPSLSPGTAGAKETYGISVLREDKTIHIPPKAFRRYNLKNNDRVFLTPTRVGECGFAILNIVKAQKSVFNKIINKIDEINIPVWINKRPYALLQTKDKSITFNNDLLNAFELKIGEKFIVIKSTSVAMSYNPIEIFKTKLKKNGFLKAIDNIEKLEIF
jgi:hypothetical protein